MEDEYVVEDDFVAMMCVDVYVQCMRGGYGGGAFGVVRGVRTREKEKGMMRTWTGNRRRGGR